MLAKGQLKGRFAFHLTGLIAATLLSAPANAAGTGVDVSACASGGQGIVGDPWTGWENNLACFGAGKSARFLPGYYASANPTELRPGVTIHCETGATIVRAAAGHHIFWSMNGPSDVTVEGCTFDSNSLAVSNDWGTEIYVHGLYLDAENNPVPTRNITIKNNRFVNLGNRVSSLISVEGPNGNGNGVLIEGNRIDGSARTPEAAIGVYAMNDVTIRGNTIVKYGTIHLQQPSSNHASATMSNLRVLNNSFVDVGYTHIFMRCIDGQDLEQVEVSGNLASTADMVDHKGLVGIGTVETGELQPCEARNVVVSGNVIRGIEGVGIYLGQPPGRVLNATVTANVIDGRKADGTMDSDSLSAGIYVVAGSENVVVVGNTVTHTARRCILASGQNVTVVGNTLEACAQFALSSPDPSGEGAIVVNVDDGDLDGSVDDGGRHVAIVANTIRDPFNASLSGGFETAAVLIHAGVTETTVSSNSIVDGRPVGSRGMDYGVRIGNDASNTATEIAVLENDIRGFNVAAWESNGPSGYRRRFAGNSGDGYLGVSLAHGASGASSSTTGGCLLWDASVDSIFEDRDCNEVKGAGEEYIGAAGIGDVTDVGSCLAGSCFTESATSSPTLYFEGSTTDGNEVALVSANPTADRTVTLPDASGTLVVATSKVTGTCGNVAIDPLPIAPGGTRTANASVAGLLAFDACVCSPRADWHASVLVKSCEAINGALEMRFFNASASSADGASVTVDYCCFRK